MQIDIVIQARGVQAPQKFYIETTELKTPMRSGKT